MVKNNVMRLCPGGCGRDLLRQDDAEVMVITLLSGPEPETEICIECHLAEQAELAYEFAQEGAEHQRGWTPDDLRGGR
jgi:hypothetical protein